MSLAQYDTIRRNQEKKRWMGMISKSQIMAEIRKDSCYDRTYEMSNNDLLELVHRLNVDKLTQEDLADLIHCCKNCISKYKTCAGYFKHWQHFKSKFEELYRN